MNTLRIAHQRRYPPPESRIERAAPGIRWMLVLSVLLWPLLVLFGVAVFSLFGA